MIKPTQSNPKSYYLTQSQSKSPSNALRAPTGSGPLLSPQHDFLSLASQHFGLLLTFLLFLKYATYRPISESSQPTASPA